MEIRGHFCTEMFPWWVSYSAQQRWNDAFQNKPRSEKTGLRGFRPGPIQTRLYSNRRWLGAWNFGFRKKRDCTIRVAKTKALINFAVTAKNRYCHNEAQMITSIRSYQVFRFNIIWFVMSNFEIDLHVFIKFDWMVVFICPFWKLNHSYVYTFGKHTLCI